jgi:hypothetical protein
VELILVYFFAALATSVVCYFSLYAPVVEELRELEPMPYVVAGTNKYLLLAVLSIITILVAPLFLPIYLVQDYSERFRTALFNNLRNEQ